MDDGAERVGVKDPEEGSVVWCGRSEAFGAAKKLVDHVSGFYAGDIIGCGEAGAGLRGYGSDEDFAVRRKHFGYVCVFIEAVVIAVVQPWWGQ